LRAYEHRAVGDAATGGAAVNLAGDQGEDDFLLGFGDVVALSGDFFRPHDEPRRRTAPDHGRSLFELAKSPGTVGLSLGTRDEIVCALKVATVDEAVADARFEPGGRFGDYRFSPGADLSIVERRIRDRYLGLAASNDDHFASPGRSDAPTGSGFGSALSAYRHLHQVALDEAWRLGDRGGDISHALAREAAAQHYLTDAFAAGHLRTPVASIRRYWKAAYPEFWERLQRKVAADTAAALQELSLMLRLLPHRFVHRRALSVVTARTRQYPELSVGDLVARAFHDWDNVHGLIVDGGGILYGDGHIDNGVTTALAVAAARAGTDDVEVAFGLAASRRRLSGEALYAAVREATGAVGDGFVPEERVPRLSPGNRAQNWRADTVESLWASPMVGADGPTVGDALIAMLEPGEQFIRQVESLGRGLGGGQGVFAVPVLGSWLGEKCCQAYHHGFVEPLADDPQRALLSVVASRASNDQGAAAPDEATVP
jgi:hypothetical protein